jgi:hypothetical protein
MDCSALTQRLYDNKGNPSELRSVVAKLTQAGLMLPFKWNYGYYSKYVMRARYSESTTTALTERSSALSAAVAVSVKKGKTPTPKAPSSDPTAPPAAAPTVPPSAAPLVVNNINYGNGNGNGNSASDKAAPAPAAPILADAADAVIPVSNLNGGNGAQAAFDMKSAFSESLGTKSSQSELSVVQSTAGNCAWGDDLTWRSCDTTDMKVWDGMQPSIAYGGDHTAGPAGRGPGGPGSAAAVRG